MTTDAPAQPSQDTNPADPSAATPATGASTIRAQIDAYVQGKIADGFVVDQLVQSLGGAIIEKRVSLLTKAWEKLNALEKDLDGINKPDISNFDGPGKDAVETKGYSAGRRQQIAQKQAALTKFQAALDKAVLGQNFTELEKALKGGDGGHQQGQKSQKDASGATDDAEASA